MNQFWEILDFCWGSQADAEDLAEAAGAGDEDDVREDRRAAGDDGEANDDEDDHDGDGGDGSDHDGDAGDGYDGYDPDHAMVEPSENEFQLNNLGWDHHEDCLKGSVIDDSVFVEESQKDPLDLSLKDLEDEVAETTLDSPSVGESPLKAECSSPPCAATPAAKVLPDKLVHSKSKDITAKIAALRCNRLKKKTLNNSLS